MSTSIKYKRYTIFIITDYDEKTFFMCYKLLSADNWHSGCTALTFTDAHEVG